MRRILAKTGNFFYRVGLYSLGGLTVLSIGLAALWVICQIWGQAPRGPTWYT